ncbi:MAG: NAD(P)-binding domain-containing protein, partial [Anaerolineales bacterium]|nr:NAD(P)-binding domain-containing protein [Anaerolineales bacterium]
MFADNTLAFIGSGIMAEAMIRGLINQKLVDPKQIISSDPRADRAQELQAQYGIQVTSDNTEAAEKGDIIILAVKPQVLSKVMPDIRGHLRRRNLLLSILAGAPIKTIADGLAHAAVVRAMPNTPAQIGKGITVWTSTPEVSEEQKRQAQAILGALGQE